MSLGDYLSNEDKKALLLPNGLVVGTVIRAFVNFTRPPKEKRFIVVGFHENKIELAVILINSEINQNINFSRELQSHHIFLKAKGRGYLSHDSHVDCTELHQIEVDLIDSSINKNPDICIGSIDKIDLDIIMRRLIDSEFIKGKHKKRCGLFNYKF